jgi:PAS domain S-box-containing protein
MFRIFGIDKNTYKGRLGDVISKVIHPDDLHLVLPSNAANLAAGPIEYRIILPDTSIRNIWAKPGATVFDQDGKPTLMTGVAQDITERKRAEDEIRRISRFPSENPNPIMRFSQSGRILYANPASQPILNHWQRAKGQDLPADWCSRIEAVIESGQSQEVEVNCAGRFFYCTLAPISGEDYLNLYGLDITERKQAEQKILYQATLLEKVSDAIVASDAQFRLTVWNSAAESLYGWKADEVLGRNGLEIMQIEWLAADADEMRRTIREKNQHRGEATQSCKDGSRITVEILSLVLHDENGNITGYLSISHDISERKQADEHLKEQLEELKRWHDITLGRESRILDLKHEVNDLLKKAGQPPRYPSAEKQDQEK